MKGIIIVGSPRKDGNTSFLVNQLTALLEKQLEIEIIFLCDYKIHYCKGCQTCDKTNVCVIEDDMELLSKKLKESQVIIIASPVYMGGVTSLLRAFMERSWPLRKGQLAGKIGSHIIVGRREIGTAIHAVEDYLYRLKVKRMPGVLGFGFQKGEVQQDTEALSRLKNLAEQLLIETKLF